ncbi:MAG: glycosyl transferase family 90 [Rikenellaceae bacterium]
MLFTHSKKVRYKKNNRFLYFVSYAFDSIKPTFIKRLERQKVLSLYEKLTKEQKELVDRRVALCNSLNNKNFDFNNPEEAVYRVKDLKLHGYYNGKRSNGNYCIDTAKYLRCYKRSLNCCFTFGDITHIPIQPSFVKSRPITENNSNSVLLALDKIRHFYFIKDYISFEDKEDKLIGISYASQPHRQDFFKKYFNHPKCKLGSICHFTDERKAWNIGYVSTYEHLKYKFILCLEGNDVATNLKWVMSSNSLAVMPKPKYETWFLESTLVGGVHYVEIKDDYSDLDEKMNYYISHPEEANKIINAAHNYVEQFRNKKIEDLVSIMVIDKYFKETKQK